MIPRTKHTPVLLVETSAEVGHSITAAAVAATSVTIAVTSTAVAVYIGVTIAATIPCC